MTAIFSRVVCRQLMIAVLFACVVVVAASAGETSQRLQQIRERLRQEAGARAVADRDADLPLVPVTVLPGDTHRRLALELTGTRDAEKLLRRIEPQLRTGQKIFVPRAVLAPRLSDPRYASLTLGGEHPTLWSLVRARTVTRGSTIAVTVRNVQRLNHVADPTRLPKGAKVLVPLSLLVSKPTVAPGVALDRTHRVTDLSGLQRRPREGEFPAELRRKLQQRGVWKTQLAPREVNLVVLHTTEHRGAPEDNVARYMRRNRLTHYLIGRAGVVYEIVPERYRAFGTGQSLWGGHYGVDHESINIELLADTAPGRHRRGITAAQYTGLKQLLADIRARRPQIHPGRVVTHRMVAFSYTYGTRSRKGDPYTFDWAAAGLPDNSVVIDQDVLLGRAELCTDQRYSDRVTEGQTAAARYQHAL